MKAEANKAMIWKTCSSGDLNYNYIPIYLSALSVYFEAWPMQINADTFYMDKGLTPL